MKEYAFKCKNNKQDNFAGKFYGKILLCLMMFFFIFTFCKLNPDASEYVKNILNNSYDVKKIEKHKDAIIDKAKAVYKNIESYITWEE